MQYDAVTLDANIFMQNSFNLEGGMLAQLAQFKEGSAQFVLSEIVLREVHKHLKDKAKDAKDTLEKAIKKLNKNALLSADAAAQINNIHTATSSPEDAAVQRLKNFQEKTGATVVAADETDIKELIKLYFTPSPPFEASGKKKSEFPDAIALLSLERWAKSNNKKILAISQDSGWDDYAKDSEWIDVERDLAVALQKLQQHTDQAKAFVGSLLADLQANKKPDILERITEEISESVSQMTVYGEASSDHRVEVEMVEMSFQNFQFLGGDADYGFKIVQVGKRKIVAKIGIVVSALADGEVSFYVWDSIDKEEMFMGSESAHKEVEFDAAILLTLRGDFVAQPPDFEIASVELVDAIDTVDFGWVELDLRDEYDDR